MLKAFCLSSACALGCAFLLVGLTLHGQTLVRTSSEGAASLAGTVKLAGTTALEGIAVSARSVDRPMTTTVFTNAQGEYFFPDLDAGNYRLWAQTTGYKTGHVAGTVAVGGRQARHDFALATIEDFTPQLSGSEWLNALPEDTFENRRMKENFRVQCTECHQPNLVLQNKFDERGWLAILNVMESPARWNKGFAGLPPNPTKTIRYHKAEMAKWLAKMRGPEPSPMKFTIAPRPTGDAARVVITEYDIPLAHSPNELVLWNGSDWSEGTASWGNGGRGLHDIAIDHAGTAWVTTWHANPARERTVLKLDPKTGTTTGFKLGDPNLVSTTHGIVTDPKGILWFNMQQDGSLGRLDPKTETFQIYRPPVGLAPIGGTLDTDKNGNIWVGAPNGALKFDPTTGIFRYFQNASLGGGFSYGVAADAQGNAFWGLWMMDRVGFADAKTGKTEEIWMRPPDSPKPESFMTPQDREFYHNNGGLTYLNDNHVPGSQVPRRMGADKQGDAVYVANWWGGNLAKIDIKTRKPTYYHLPKGLHAYSAVVDRNRMVFANTSDDAIAKLNPQTGQWTVYQLPSRGTESRHLMTDDRKGELWVVYSVTNRVARMQFRTQDQLQALKTASTAAAAGTR